MLPRLFLKNQTNYRFLRFCNSHMNSLSQRKITRCFNAVGWHRGGTLLQRSSVDSDDVRCFSNFSVNLGTCCCWCCQDRPVRHKGMSLALLLIPQCGGVWGWEHTTSGWLWHHSTEFMWFFHMT